jgi:mannose-1-phosphate guanylyltransferase
MLGMITVIIAGGSGTRLWPLSTPDYPKHLLKINGDQNSLLQNTYERAKRVSDTTYVITEIGHAHHIKEQLPELNDDNFVIEPARRGTASCIVAALAHISSRHDADEPIIVSSADHFVRDADGFAHSFRVASEASARSGRIVLVGVEPDHPATGFGYIQKDGVFDEELFVYNVHSFKEKPAHDVAQEYVRSGNYLWNCGYFVGSLNTFKNNMKDHAPTLLDDYEKLVAAKSPEEYEQTYLGFENETIDYGLIEKVDDLLVVPAAFDWMDLGSFGDIHKAVVSDEQGNYTNGNKVALVNVENSFVQNNEDKPIAVIGLDNVVVVNTPQGILVARKDLSQKVKEAVAQLEEQK